MAELMFGLGQTKKKKETEAKITQTKKDTWKYQGRPDEAVESQVRSQQHNREKSEKATRTETKTNLREVNMALDTVESEVRKEQHQREKNWKETGKQQKDANTNFDMARALFN
mmetsp:Transcript_43203/g.122166  ORF Transcript_43203/g.122166 Transcript_43203/m.122166 type:complete len:113 (-) Transcript_43203:128-466(-)|eukprot:CAMPEP_0176260510 /NCGR_PEP_ID=MMETSP0121_2-20121125/39620_1 /TAXON_ID=160619 /ORGANISM="Kryptoperidinium foliaceum, Strain CCMP 1326" /LENGTH=112 /DNA_ID=CAMNT_0017600423 /DNA_START=118 /DNA_END=456 /DNA_ORIENTATION=+